jgi:phytoene dehydrogenase-like protein
MGGIEGAFRSWWLSRGGTGAISNAIAGAARRAGVEIRARRRSRRLLVRGNKGSAASVLKNGDEFEADEWPRASTPLTFLRFIESGALPDDFSRTCIATNSAAPQGK